MSNGHGGARPGAGRPRKSGDSAYADFTTEQLKSLLDSPYVLNISKTSIAFTQAFKQLFWQRYIDGIEPYLIFEEADLPVKVISRKRIYSFVKALKLQMEKEAEAANRDDVDETTNVTPPRKANHTKAPTLSEAEIANLVNQVSYMSQELAFLKKIISVKKEKE